VRSLYIDNAQVFESGFAMVRHWQPTAPRAAERLSSIRQPGVIVVGDHDSEDVRTTARKLAGSIKDVECVVIENAGHLVSLDAPEAFTAVVVDFVASKHILSG
jgi:pimeloyl-ACP methyl ester carboxylesterase